LGKNCGKGMTQVNSLSRGKEPFWNGEKGLVEKGSGVRATGWREKEKNIYVKKG